LKEISAKYGCLQVAREIRDTVQRMPDTGADGVAYKKNRGYDLASDLFLQHARKRLEGSDSKAALYDVATVADEIQQCLFACNRCVKGIDIGLDLMHAVLERACVTMGPSEEYLKTAQEIVGRMLEGALAADEAGRASKKSENGSSDADATAVPAPLLEFVSAMNERLRLLRRRMGEAATKEPRARAEHLKNVCEDATSVSLSGLAARALEESAAMLAESNVDRARALRQHAFKFYEKGRTEASGVGLRFLAHRFAQAAARTEA
jgi:hypothetical protein